MYLSLESEWNEHNLSLTEFVYYEEKFILADTFVVIFKFPNDYGAKVVNTVTNEFFRKNFYGIADNGVYLLMPIKFIKDIWKQTYDTPVGTVTRYYLSADEVYEFLMMLKDM